MADAADIYEAEPDNEAVPSKDELWEMVQVLRSEVDTLKLSGGGATSAQLEEPAPDSLRVPAGKWFDVTNGIRAFGNFVHMIQFVFYGASPVIRSYAEFFDFHGGFFRVFCGTIELFGKVFIRGSANSIDMYADDAGGNSPAFNFINRTPTGDQFSSLRSIDNGDGRFYTNIACGDSDFRVWSDGEVAINGKKVLTEA